MNRALWSYRVNASTKDLQRLRIFVREEVHYHNALVSGLNGPIRSMPDVFRDLIGANEKIYAEVAAYAVDLRQARSLPASLEPYRDTIYENGTLKLSPKMMIVLDVVKTPSNLHVEARRSMAMTFLSSAKDQSAAFHNTLSENNRLGHVYKYAPETLQAVDEQIKRHVQLPKSAIKMTENGRNVVFKFPYMMEEFTIPAPQILWNKIYMRELIKPDGQSSGMIMLEFASESHYDMRRVDALPYTRKKARRDDRTKV